MAIVPDSSHASSSSSGVETLLYTLTLGSAGVFDQAAISGSYNDLILIALLRGSNAALQDGVGLVINNDNAGNYNQERINGSAAVTTSQEQLGAASIQLGNIAAATALGNRFAGVKIEILGYASATWHKAVMWTNWSSADNGTTDTVIYHGGSTWLNTAAITRVALRGNATANFVTGSQLRIYGRL